MNRLYDSFTFRWFWRATASLCDEVHLKPSKLMLISGGVRSWLRRCRPALYLPSSHQSPVGGRRALGRHCASRRHQLAAVSCLRRLARRITSVKQFKLFVACEWSATAPVSTQPSVLQHWSATASASAQPSVLQHWFHLQKWWLQHVRQRWESKSSNARVWYWLYGW